MEVNKIGQLSSGKGDRAVEMCVLGGYNCTSLLDCSESTMSCEMPLGPELFIDKLSVGSSRLAGSGLGVQSDLRLPHMFGNGFRRVGSHCVGRNGYSTDVQCLLVIAVLEIYGVIREHLTEHRWCLPQVYTIGGLSIRPVDAGVAQLCVWLALARLTFYRGLRGWIYFGSPTSGPFPSRE